MVEKNKNIIGLCGRQRSGKTMLGEYLVENKGYKRVYIAQALKELCSEILGMSIDEMNSKKNEPIDFKLTDDHAHLISDRCQISLNEVKRKFEGIHNTITSVRHALQFIGTDLIRVYHPNWHIETMLASMKPNEKYVIDDVRFPNEAQILQQYGVTFIFIIRPILTNISHHASEESLRWQDINNIIINNQDKDYAIKQLNDIIEMQKNDIAEEFLAKYHSSSHGTYHNKCRVQIINDNDPIKIDVWDNTTGYIIGQFNSIDNPLEFEDLKFIL